MRSYNTFLLKHQEIGAVVSRINPTPDSSVKYTDEKYKFNLTVLHGLLVLLSGALEGFLRGLIEDYVDYVNENKLRIDVVPSSVLCGYLTFAQSNFRQKKPESFEGLLRGLRNGEHVSLKNSGMAKTEGNPSVDVIEAIFSDLGIPSIIDELSIKDFGVDSTFSTESQFDDRTKNRISTLIDTHASPNSALLMEQVLGILEQKWMPKRKRRKVGYVQLIEALLKLRNRLAHGEGYDEISFDEFSRFYVQVGELTRGLNDRVTTYLADLKARHESLLVPA